MVLGMKYWKYSPGRRAYYWDYCRDNSLMAIGWQNVGDLSQLLSFDEFTNAVKRAGWPSGKWNTGDTQLWDLVKRCKIGDIVAAYGRGFILSIGKVKGEYYFDDKNAIDKTRDIWFSHRRCVKWKSNTGKDVSNDEKLYGHPWDTYGTLIKRLTFYELTDPYTIKIINDSIL